MLGQIQRNDGRQSADEELQDSIRDALMTNGSTHIWGHSLEIVARDGIVELKGHVRTRPGRAMAENVARRVPGVRQLNSSLIVDTELEVAVAQALAGDARTVKGFPGLLVGSAFGEVFLKGCVPSQEVKEAASQVAAQVTGVREVMNELVAPEPPKPAAPAKPAVKAAPKPAPKPAEEETTASAEEE